MNHLQLCRSSASMYSLLFKVISTVSLCFVEKFASVYNITHKFTLIALLYDSPCSHSFRSICLFSVNTVTVYYLWLLCSEVGEVG